MLNDILKMIFDRMPSTWDEETRLAALEDSRRKQALANTNRPKTEIQKQRMSAAKKGIPKPKVQCPHCGILCAVNVAGRWHFDNCKYKKEFK
jgi:hypothetical protein